jgi:hypothetical protein
MRPDAKALPDGEILGYNTRSVGGGQEEEENVEMLLAARQIGSLRSQHSQRSLLGEAVKRGVCLAAFAAAMSCLPKGGGEPSFSVPPYLQSVTESSIIVCWESDGESDGVVEYWVEGTQDSLVMPVESDSRHEARLEGLEAGTAYRYRVRVPAEGPGTFFAGQFRTAPAGNAPFVFAVYGDSRENTWDAQNHRSVVEGIMAVNPALVIHMGDIVSCGDYAPYWDILWGTVAAPEGEASLVGNVPFYPVLGNHEYMSSAGGYKDEAIQKYLSYFVVPSNGLEAEYPEWGERFYSFRYGPAFFIVLDINNDSDPEYDTNSSLETGPPDIHPGSPQYEWLIEQLEGARTESVFTFVLFHPPPYSSGPWGKTNCYKLRFLDPVFREYGVDAVLASHDHFYERCETYVDGYRLLYFVEGAGGAPRYSRQAGWDVPGSWMWDSLNQTFYTKAYDNSTFSFIKVAIEPVGGGLWRAVFSATRPGGEVFDVAQIVRPRAHVEMGEAFTFTFEAVPGQLYQVEYTEDLPGTETEWLPLGSPILAEDTFVRIVDDGTETGVPPTDGAVRQRFYRVQELP